MRSARGFFFTKFGVTRLSFDEQVKLMFTEFDSDSRQLEAQSELEIVTLSRVMKETDTANVNVCLDLLVQRFTSVYSMS